MRRSQRQAGQAVVIIAFMIVVIVGAIGLAVDGGIAYYYNALAERAAASAALSGVVFMPYQFTPSQALPAGSGYDATDRAIINARRNGFDTNSGVSCTSTCTATGANGITVTTSPITGADNKLQVTVSRTVTTFFMGFFGLATYTVSRTAIATYLPPIKLGQSGGQVGTTVSKLGSGGSNYYFMRTEGWGTDRGQGDAFTPAPTGCSSPECPSKDYHQLSAYAGTDTADPTLPGEGGYNFMVTVPAGSTAQIQVYNAAFAPDGNVSGPNYCENWQGTPTCSGGGNYYMHEDDCCAFNYSSKTTYSAMKYTIYSAPSVFIRNTDTVLSQMLVKPVDASCWKVAGGTCNQVGYTDVGTSSSDNVIRQRYAVTGAPLNMLAYHAWMDVGGYVPDTNCNPGACGGGFESEANLISYIKGPIGNLGPGTYRLRVDTLEYDGSNPCSPYPTSCNGKSYAHKGFALRVTDGGGVSICGGCTLSALDDMAIYTPINAAGGTSFPLQIFQLPPDYAGQTIGFEVFDAGDMSGSGQIYLGLIDPTTNSLVVEPSGGQAANVYDCGSQRINYPASCTTIGSYANPSGVEQIVANGGSLLGDNKWYHYDVPIPSTYSPGGNPANWWWSLNYRVTANVKATDTITITLNLKGNPAHLLQS